jgi:hypothetical protein
MRDLYEFIVQANAILERRFYLENIKSTLRKRRKKSLTSCSSWTNDVARLTTLEISVRCFSVQIDLVG